MPNQSNLDDQATLEMFGYYASSLDPLSENIIICICCTCSRQIKAKRRKVKENKECGSCLYKNGGISLEEVKEDILRVVKELGYQPTVKEYGRFGKYGRTIAWTKFKRPWREVLQNIGLKPQRNNYSAKDIEKDLKRVKNELGHLPSVREYRKLGIMSDKTVKTVLKCYHWEEVISKAFNLDLDSAKAYGKNPRYHTTKDLLKKLNLLAENLGYSPTAEEAQTNGINITALYKRLKTDWVGILKLANLDTKSLSIFSKRRFIKNPDIANDIKQDIIKDIRQVKIKLGKIPTRDEYMPNGKYCREKIKTIFGSWANALKASFDLKDLYKLKSSIERPDTYYLELLNDLANKLGRSPNSKEAAKHGISVRILYERFNTNWAGILAKAGLSKTSLPYQSRFRATTNQEILADLKRVKDILGVFPSILEYQQHGSFNSISVIDRFGKKWGEVLEVLEQYLELEPKFDLKETTAISKEQKTNKGTPKEQISDSSTKNICLFFNK